MSQLFSLTFWAAVAKVVLLIGGAALLGHWLSREPEGGGRHRSGPGS